MVQNYLSCSCYSAFSNLQLQSRLPGVSRHQSCFAARSRANAFCHSRLQSCIAGASHWINQRSHSAGIGYSASQIRGCSECDRFERFFVCETATVCYTFCRPHLPKVLRTCKFLTFKCKSSSRHSPVHFLSATFADRAPNPRKQRPYFGDPRSHMTRQKTQSFAPESVFARELTRFRTVTLPSYLTMMWLTWWCGWHDDVVDMMMEMLTMTIVRNSEVFY